MSDKITHHNDTPTDEFDPLRGGTQVTPGGGPVNVGGEPGGTNAVSPAGQSMGEQPKLPQTRGTRTDSRSDPESAFEGTRHQSQGVAKQFARDEADVDTEPRSPNGAGEPRFHQIHPTEKKPD